MSVFFTFLAKIPYQYVNFMSEINRSAKCEKISDLFIPVILHVSKKDLVQLAFKISILTFLIMAEQAVFRLYLFLLNKKYDYFEIQKVRLFF